MTQQRIIISFILLCLMIGTLIFKFELPIITAAVIGLGILALTFIYPDLATLAIVFVFYTNLAVVAHKFHGVPKLAASSFMGILILPIFIYFLRGIRPIIDRTFLLMLVFLVIVLVASLFGRDIYSSFDEWISIYLVEGILLYLLMLNVIRSTDTLKRVIWTLLLAGSVMGGASVFQEATKSYSNKMGGFAQTGNENPSMATINKNREGKKVKRHRLAGPIGEQNRYAQILVVLIPLAFYRLRGERSLILRIMAAGAGMLILGGIFLTFSQGAAVTLVMLFMLMIGLKQIKPRYSLAVLAVILAMIFTVPDYIGRIAGIGRLQGLISSSAGVEPSSSMMGRATENLAAVNIFLDHPILGVGPGQYKFFSAEYGNVLGLKRLNESRRAHSIYLEVLADVGIIGFVLFMAIALLIMYRLWQSHRRWLGSRPDLSNLAATLFFSLCAYLMSATFLHLSYMRYYWFLLAIAGATEQILREEGLMKDQMKGELNVTLPSRS